MKAFPKARRENLVVREFADELLVYDKERHAAHCLNRTAALIWRNCDGRRSVTEIGRRLASVLDEPDSIDERVVIYALEQLRRDHLLEAAEFEVPSGRLPTNLLVDRRQMMRALGLTAAVALPVVTSMIAPAAAHAASCLGPGSGCTTGAQCCNGSCNGGTCN